MDCSLARVTVLQDVENLKWVMPFGENKRDIERVVRCAEGCRCMPSKTVRCRDKSTKNRSSL